MTDEEVLRQIEQIVRDELDDDEIHLSMTTRASDVEGWDSLAHIAIVVSVEHAFGAQFSTSEITTLKDVGHLVRLVQATR